MISIALIIDIIPFDQRQHRAKIRHKLQVISFEVLMFENWALTFMVGDNFMETIHIELSDKW